MPEKWQEIKLRLDADLADALRDLKRGHDETLAEVVLRLLRKAVRPNPASYGGPDARSGARGARSASGARGAFGAARRGKAVAREDRGGSRGTSRGKSFFKREVVAEGDTWAPAETKLEPARAPARPRPSRPSRPFKGNASKGFRPQQGKGAIERPPGGFAQANRNGEDAEGTQRGRAPRARKVKGRRPTRG